MRRLFTFAAGLLLASALTAPAAHAAAPTCFGKTATVVLTNGDDVYFATSETPEVIWAGGGNDRIYGPNPDDFGPATGLPGDLICGGPGNDVLWGGNGNDKINGGDGADSVNDSSGSDLLQGNAGDDRVVDKSCADCDGGSDTLRGQGGNDVLVNAWGNDRVYGGTGADDLYDIECDPTYLDGGPGYDYIESYVSSYEGGTCDYYDQSGTIQSRGFPDTVIGGTEFDRAQVSRADQVSGVERWSYTAPQY